MRRSAAVVVLALALAGCGKDAGGGATVAVTPTLEVAPPGAVGSNSGLRRGVRVYEQSGCAACHKLGETGNDGPGPELTRIGARLSYPAIARSLVEVNAPMPSFRNLERKEPRRFLDLVRFLAAQQ